MTATIVVLQSVVLGLLIVITEVQRPQPPIGVDARRVSAVLFFLCFCLVPLWLQVVDLRFTRDSPWRWVLHRSPMEGLAPYASAIALVCYICLLAGYAGAAGRPAATTPVLFPPDRVSQRLIAVLLGVAGTLALIGYTITIGGIVPLIFNALAFRSSDPPVVSSWAFLRSLMPLVGGASFLFYGLRRASSGRTRLGMTTGLVLTVALSLVVLFHQAGRLSLLFYILVFPLAASLMAGRLRWHVVAAGAGIILPLVVLGKQLFSADAATGVADRLTRVGENMVSVGNALMLEFSFPYITLTNAVGDVPGAMPLRWFADVPLGFLYLVPQRLLGVRHPPTISMLNSRIFESHGTVPVDLVSFGFMSLWLPGVMIVGALFGYILARAETLMPTTREPVNAVFRAAWMLFLGRTVMYGDPQLVIQACFFLLVTSAALTTLPRLRTLLRRLAVAHG